MKEKIIKKTHKLAIKLSEISIYDLDALRIADPDFNADIETISAYFGSSNPFWRIHPIYPMIRCSLNGDILINDVPYEVKEHRGKLQVCIAGKRRTIPAAICVLQCFDPLPEDQDISQFTVGYVDNDTRNIKPSNLYWERKYVK